MPLVGLTPEAISSFRSSQRSRETREKSLPNLHALKAHSH